MAFTLPPAVNFTAASRSADPLPTPQMRRAKARRFAELRQAAEVLKVLPEPGETLETLILGRWDVTAAFAVLLNRFGPANLFISTLAYSQKNLVEFTEWLQGGKLTGLTLLCSAFFKRHNRTLFEATVETLAAHKGRVAASRTHCKLYCFSFASGERIVGAGSCNTRANGCIENVSWTRGDEALFEFYSRWIGEQVTRHALDK